MIEGDFRLVGYAARLLPLLVDTGASTTEISGAGLPDVEQIYGEGEEDFADGIGGKWPASFLDEGRAVLDLQTEAGDILSLELPAVCVLAPYRRTMTYPDGRVRVARSFDGRPSTRAGPDVRQKLEKVEVPHLLGNDVLVRNCARLVWDPCGNSYLEVPDDRL